MPNSILIYFIKKVAIAAARDDNPEKASSAMQFYIVHGKIYNDSLLNKSEKYTNQNKALEYFKSNPERNLCLIQYNTLGKIKIRDD